MSDLYTLWNAGAGLAKENFTTAALAIEINREPGPILRALRSLAWPEAAPLATADGLRAAIQASHAAPDVPATSRPARAQLDVVLAGTVNGVALWEMWLEAKVDAPLGHDQLAKYEQHWQIEHPDKPLRLVVVSQTLPPPQASSTHPGNVPFAWLPWASIARSIMETSGHDPHWLDFLAFLADIQMAYPPVDGEPVEGFAAVLGVLWELNEEMRRRYEEERSSIWWPGRLSLEKNLRARRRDGLSYTTTGVGLVYGLKETPDGWCWSVGADGRLTQRHSGMTASEVSARAAQLGSTWKTGTMNALVAERTASYPTLRVGTDALDWLREAVCQLRAAGLLPPRNSVRARVTGDGAESRGIESLLRPGRSIDPEHGAT